MSSLLQDLGLVETILGDISSFAAGNAVSGSFEGYTVSVKLLPSGPAAPYEPISGSFTSILFTVLALAGQFQEGALIAIAVKENTTWYGVMVTPKAPAIVPLLTPAVS